MKALMRIPNKKERNYYSKNIYKHEVKLIVLIYETTLLYLILLIDLFKIIFLFIGKEISKLKYATFRHIIKYTKCAFL
jgi:hypothetical protein